MSDINEGFEKRRREVIARIGTMELHEPTLVRDAACSWTGIRGRGWTCELQHNPNGRPEDGGPSATLQVAERRETDSEALYWRKIQGDAQSFAQVGPWLREVAATLLKESYIADALAEKMARGGK